MRKNKLASILSLFAVVQPMIQASNTFADSKIHNENEMEKIDDKIKSESDEKNEKDIGKTQKEEQQKENDKSVSKKRNKGKIAAIVALSTLGPGLPGLAFLLKLGMSEGNMYIKFFEKIKGKVGMIGISHAKYMDTQPGGGNCWCQFYAFQGIMNKEFGIKPKITDLYDAAFSGDSSRDETKFMKDETERKVFMDKLIDQYKIQRKPYIQTFDMKLDKFKVTISQMSLKEDEVRKKIIEAMTKCGSVCINMDAGYEHAILLTDLYDDDGVTKVEFESYGIHYKAYFYDFVSNYLFRYQSKSEKPGDLKHDGVLRIYGFEK